MTPASKRKSLIAVLTIVVLIVGGWGVHSYMDYRLRGAIAVFQQSLQPDWAMNYTDMRVRPFHGSVELDNVSLQYHDTVLARAATVTLRNPSTSGGALTRADAELKQLQISATGQDVPSLPEGVAQNVVMAGDASFEYRHDPSSNSFEAGRFQFQSADQKTVLSFDKGQLRNLTVTDGKLQSFGLSIDNASYDLRGGDKPYSGKFSSAFEYAMDANGSYTVRNFSLKLPERNEYASLETLSVQHTYEGNVPVSYSASIQGLDLPLTAAGGGDLWAEYGYQRLKANGQAAYKYEAQNQKIIASLNLDLQDMFRFNAAFDLIGVNMEQLIKNPAMAALFTGASLQGAQIEFADASFVKKTIEIQAKKQNISVADYTAQWGARIDQELIGDAKTADPAMVDAAGKLKAYLSSLGTLNIHMKPQQPVPFSQFLAGLIIDRAKLLRMMGISVSVS